MTKSYLLKSFITGIMLAAGTYSIGQCVHPINYVTTNNNSFASWVGERFDITSPPSIAGDKIFTTPNDGSGATGVWGGFPGVGSASAIVNDTFINYPSDSCVALSVTITTDMSGKVALLYRGAGIEFGRKALSAQNAGANAVVIVNNVSGGPVGMGAGASGSGVSIPVFMVSKTDGDAINAQLHAGVKPTLTVVNWGQGLTNDLGFVSRGIAQWHNGAIPAYELEAGGDPLAYRGFDGAYVANFGTSTVDNVTLVSSTTFTPSGGSTINVHSDTVILSSFPQIDSIWGMFAPQYNLISSITGTGTIDVTYNLSAPGFVDQYPFDNVATYQVQVTDNVYTKGRWDEANSRPYCTFYTGAGANSAGTLDPYIWGPTFYINSGRYANNSIFSLVVATTTGIDWVIPSSTVNLWLYKWVDGRIDSSTTPPTAYPTDSIPQVGEMQLVGLATKTFNGTTDSSFKFYTVTYGDSLGTAGNILMESNSWYWVAAEMPQSASTNYSIGCDGVNNGFPRFMGRDTFNNYKEFYAPLWAGGGLTTGTYPMSIYPTNDLSIVPFNGTYLVTSVDSTVFSSEKGLIPNISLTTSTFPTKVENRKPAFAEFNLFPNPANDRINVSLGLDNAAKQVTYKVLNTAGQVVSSETHNNVQKEKYTVNTEKLPAGTYYIAIIADEKSMFKKFSVMH